ncbi:MAG TPA: chaperone NapD [Beijerinckiaceae bacterium]|nr:chaperone NapD [Beijerinckiaceae bacterium]
MTIASQSDALNVVGCVVQTAPGKASSVRENLIGLPGVDVHAEAEDGRLVITILDTDSGMAIDQLAAINRMPGVVSTMLAYHGIDHSHPVEDGSSAGCSTCSSSDRTSSRFSERA